jgi:hypothetical protein
VLRLGVIGGTYSKCSADLPAGMDLRAVDQLRGALLRQRGNQRSKGPGFAISQCKANALSTTVEGCSLITVKYNLHCGPQSIAQSPGKVFAD